MMDWLDRHLVPEWKNAWQLWSNQFAVAMGVIGTILSTNTDVVLTIVGLLAGAGWLQWIIIGATVFVIALRLWNQEKSNESNQEFDSEHTE